MALTEADKRRAVELAVTIKDAPDEVQEAAAWRELVALLGVGFVIHWIDATGQRVGDVVNVRWDGDAERDLAAAGRGHAAATEARLYALERLDAPTRRWTWNANTGRWDDA